MSTSSLPLPDFDDENLHRHRHRHKEDMLKEQRISNQYSNKSSQSTNSTDDNKQDKNSDRIRDAENENVENINTGSEMKKCIDNNNNNNSSKNSSSHSNVAIQNDGNSAAVSVNRSNDKSVDINDTDNNDGGGDGCGSSRERFNNKYCNDIQRIRKQCGAIVNNFYVQLVMVAFIVINAIMMGIATYDFIKDNPEYSRAFELTDKTFLVIFTIELVMQGIYHGIYMFKDGWLVFDFIIISISWAFQEVQIVRAFRIFRAFRLLTRVKIMRNLILALVEVMPRMAAIVLMLLLIFYIFGVMFTQLFSEVVFIDADYFGNLAWTFLTLFQIMTLDGWASISREAMETYWWAWLPFCAFVIISGFIIVNLIIAVICDAIGMLDEETQENLYGVGVDSESEIEDEAPTELREQLDQLEDQMGQLTRMQARTFHTLQYLTQQLQTQKEAKERNKQLKKEEKVKRRGKTEKLTLSSSDGEKTSSSKTGEKKSLSLSSPSPGGGGLSSPQLSSASSKRVSYRDSLSGGRRASVSNFAKAAKELKKLREIDQNEQSSDDNDHGNDSD